MGGGNSKRTVGILRKSYSTKEIANMVGIHINTVRFYEKIGFLTKPKRKKNGYRVYTDLQLEQCRLIRCAMRAEVMQNGLRAKAIEIIRLCAAGEYDASLSAAAQYRVMIKNEICRAESAICSVENILKTHDDRTVSLCRKDASESLGVTPETLRTWERNGLINVRRSENGYRMYSSRDMERLNIIRTLRMAGYSLSAILRLLNALDSHTSQSVKKILNTATSDDEIISVCDRLIVSLQATESDAETLADMLENVKRKFSTLQ